MGQMIKLQSATAIDAYVSEPAGPSKGGIVVIQEIFGVTGHICDIANRVAAAGYTAIAPALFDSVQPGVKLGYGEDGMREGIALMRKVGMERPLQDVAAAAAHVAGAGKVGTVGFCWGGTVAYAAAIELGLPGVSYYGGGNTHFVDRPTKAPVMFHYGEKDTHISAEDRAKVAEANPDAPLYLYNAGHAFNRDVDSSTYDASSAQLAWQRTLAFLAEHVG
ncbi:dienelactone hydrolase family protein [Dyella sp.]|jgi:carboxymethylenebutenolidase|uniref:dienelactone hydrolase family protein n=1 Tax=Dyella sp. TaxID=1869338 RepID=UPI002D773354|nr:dienelactone hydrolase family protein [Dyella sp.]HET6432597.1 dienelactone hydrolase family protein [Dyella sp.]